ncbi:hypothetical protein KDW_29820 [Dictyobacter vulcani]|uniref:Uncharacterized protein n=1 Tax=Dictyobacter vulcani TaxID=2607529 RepID=A0A5J4KQV2_9CHLR|nr:hypothetical protein KDW_29820 [Dictyobacter vulcani]
MGTVLPRQVDKNIFKQKAHKNSLSKQTQNQRLPRHYSDQAVHNEFLDECYTTTQLGWKTPK